MENNLNEKKERNISPNKIKLPLSDDENGILDEYIQTKDQNCLDTFTCSICDCLAWDPVSCSKCDKIFCRSCILKYAEKKNICPFRCESYTIREITRNEKDYLNKITIKCTNLDCSQYFKYYDYKSHLEKCKYRKYHCKNDPCKVEGYINDMISHSQKCEFRRIICEKCKQKVKICEIEMHQKKECPENIVNCKLCGQKMKRGIYITKHRSKNNDNPNCLKVQLENMSKSLKKEIDSKNNEINDLKKKNRELIKKNEKYEVENNNLKKKLEEIKQYIKNGYNSFILEENKENNKEKKQEDISNININEEMNKKEKEFSKNQKMKDNNSIERKYLDTGSNFHTRNKIIGFFSSNNNNNNNTEENLYNKSYFKRNVPHIEVKDQNAPFHHLKKVPSMNYLSNSTKNQYQRNINFFPNKK